MDGIEPSFKVLQTYTYPLGHMAVVIYYIKHPAGIHYTLKLRVVY
jgi:hypothetical protein